MKKESGLDDIPQENCSPTVEYQPPDFNMFETSYEEEKCPPRRARHNDEAHSEENDMTNNTFNI